MKKIVTLITLIILMMTLPGCINNDEKVDIYASIYPLYFLTDYIVEDKLVVKQVYPSGADVHDYDPGNGKELLKMSKAKIMFYIGAGLEGFISKSQSIFNNSQIQLVELSDYIKLCKQTNDGYAYLTSEDRDTIIGIADTHVWLDPLRMVTMANVILEEVIKIDQDNEQFYRDNHARLVDELKKLDTTYSISLSNDKYEKIIIVDHDSYLYLEERYGIKRIRTRIDNESCDSAPSNINANIETAKQYNIKYIVTTANESVCKIINKYASTLDAKIVELNHLSTLYKKDEEENKDYFTIMYENLWVLLEILPEKQ